MTIISAISRQIATEKIRDWALQYGVPEKSVLLAVNGLVPSAWLLWEKHHLQQWTVQTSFSELESQLMGVFQQNPAIFPALCAFSGMPLPALQNMFPSVIHDLSRIMSAQFQGKSLSELERWFHLGKDEAEVLLPSSVRAVTPELQASPRLLSRPVAISTWLEGFFWLLLLGCLFYWML
ncbi:MAG: hypothetical protein IT261_11900 [Saprospiraceae bacterium]|nr:hypothetical protein [Saprospiraceae bacterium]